MVSYGRKKIEDKERQSHKSYNDTQGWGQGENEKQHRQRQNLSNNILIGGIKNMVTEDILNLHCTLKVRALTNSPINSPIYPHIHPQMT